MWRIVSAATAAGEWSRALESRGVEARCEEAWPEQIRPDEVIVSVGKPPVADAGRGVVIELPEVMARGAPPDVVAEYLLARARAELSERTVTRWRRQLFDVAERVTHDIKNQLAVLQANDSFIWPVPSDNADVREAAQDSREATRVVDQAASDLLLMAALELTSRVRHNERVSVASLVEAGRLRAGQLLATRRNTLAVEVASDLVVAGDAAMLATMIGSLIAARARLVARSVIVVRAWREGDQVALVIADQGPTVPIEDRLHIFEGVGSGMKRARDFGALGVGMYLTRLIAEAHGGHVGVVDLPPYASCFRFTLPADLGS